MSALGADVIKTPVFVSAQTQGQIGEQLVFELREQLRASQALQLAATASDAANEVHLNTLDNGDGQVVYAVVWLNGNGKQLPTYRTSTVGYCGSSILPNCARSILSRTDDMITDDGSVWAVITKKMVEEVKQKKAAEEK